MTCFTDQIHKQKLGWKPGPDRFNVKQTGFSSNVILATQKATQVLFYKDQCEGFILPFVAYILDSYANLAGKQTRFPKHGRMDFARPGSAKNTRREYHRIQNPKLTLFWTDKTQPSLAKKQGIKTITNVISTYFGFVLLFKIITVKSQGRL